MHVEQGYETRTGIELHRVGGLVKQPDQGVEAGFFSDGELLDSPEDSFELLSVSLDGPEGSLEPLSPDFLA